MNNLKYLILGLFAVLSIISCTSNEDDNMEVSEHKVDAYIQFENVFGSSEFYLNNDYSTADNVELNISMLKYMITDIIFFGSNGTADYAVSTQESFHIVDQSCDATKYKYLTGIPNGTYSKISIRYGVSEEIFELGTDAQGEMLIAAKEFGMNWSWTAGYRFLTYEGFYGGNAMNTFKVHNGSHGSSMAHHKGSYTAKETDDMPMRIDNSKVIVLEFPNETAILVSDETSPKVHLKVDISKILNSTNVLDITEGNIIIDEHKSPKIAENAATLFSVAHLHPTDPNFDVPTIESCAASNPNEDHGQHE